LRWSTGNIRAGPENSIEISDNAFENYECYRSAVVFAWAADSRMHMFDNLTQPDAAVTNAETEFGTFLDSPVISVSGIHFPDAAPGLITYEASSFSGWFEVN